MFCSKFGGECPQPAAKDDKFVFVMMPFKDSDSIYDAIKRAVEGIPLENGCFTCNRADDSYTNLSIWCSQICKNIRKAKYIIADITGRNANVFYELGFAHSMDNTKAVIITQNVNDAPFDIKDMGLLQYSEKKLPKLVDDIRSAILALEKAEQEEGYTRKSPEEMIRDLKAQLNAEETRSSRFKNELLESEKREKELKERIKEIESIQNNPVEDAKNKISELEGMIAELKSKLKHTEEDKTDTIAQLTATLNEKTEKLNILEKKFNEYKENEDVKPLSDLLIDDAQKRLESQTWFNKAYDEAHKGNHAKAVKYYSKAIELDPEDIDAYNNRGNAYRALNKFEKAITDYSKVIELDSENVDAYNNRGISYHDLKKFKEAIRDYNKAIELEPSSVVSYANLLECYINMDEYGKALEAIDKVSSYCVEVKDMALCLYLECIAKKLLGISISDCEKAFNATLEKGFKTNWSSFEIESWLETADIPADTKAFIREKTEQLKKHAL